MSGGLPHADILSPHAAVVRMRLDDAAVQRIEAAARDRGFAVFAVNLAGAEDKSTLLDRTATALRFPAWFGHNWDALFDCLTDLGWFERARGYVVLLRNARDLRQSAPEVLDTALAIAEDAERVWAARGVVFALYADLDSDD
jgi:RNAse (barnase) inhibitor barstar